MPEFESEPKFSSLIVEDERAADRVRHVQPHKGGFNPWWIVAIAAAIIVGAFIYWWRQQAPSAPAIAAAPPPAAEAPPPKAPPAIRHPIDDARVNAAQNDDRGLPQLGESDALVRDALAKLQGASAFERFFHPQDIVRRFVATIDNLPRRSVAPQVTVVKPVPGAFHIAGNEGALTIGRDNAARYTPYVRFAQAIDTKTLVALYVRFYPWFQQAYQDLGYPSGYFNDRLIEVIDNVLATPEPTAPIALVQPHVLYAFANPDYEALSAGQKMMLRMGPDNAAVIRTKLRELRHLLTGVVAPPS